MMEPIAFRLLLVVLALAPRGCRPTEWDGFTPWFTGSGKYSRFYTAVSQFPILFPFIFFFLNKIYNLPDDGNAKYVSIEVYAHT